MTVWATSDEHYDHGKIIESCGRPFRGLVHMREEMIRRHNELVAPDDVVWHLGDFSFAKPAETMLIVARLNGAHHLVLGNHDRSATAMLAAGFKTVQYFARLDHNGTSVFMRHLPPAHVATDDRKFALKFYPPIDGDVVLCGHVHEKWRRHGSVFNVGVDVNAWAPVRIDDLVRESYSHGLCSGRGKLTS